MARLVLASSSVFRVKLLKQIGYAPDIIHAPDIDEDPKKGELPHKLASRLAFEKAQKIRELYPEDVILAADTIAFQGRTFMGKALDEETARAFIEKFSGRRHNVYTGVCGIYGDKVIQKIGKSNVEFKRLSDQEIELFVKSKQWYGKAGGYSIQGVTASFVSFIRGSEISNIVGLPLYETSLILSSLNLKPDVNIMTL